MGFILLGFASLIVGSAHGVLAGLGVFAPLAAAIAWGWRRSMARGAVEPLVGIPQAVMEKVSVLPPSLPEAAEWRLERALGTVHHLAVLLEHAPFGGDLADVAALRNDAKTCLERVVERCEALVDLYAVQGPSEAVVAASRTVQREIDEHLVSLGGAMDAVASYVAIGTRDAAQTLRERADQLHAIAGSLRELEAGRTVALPPAHDLV